MSDTPRIPRATRDTIAPDAQAVWDRLEAVRPGLQGPYAMLMHVPALAARVADEEDYFRLDAALSAADCELVVLTALRELEGHYGWTRHEPRARQVGTRAEAIEAVRAKAAVDGLAPRDQLLIEVTRTLLRERGLPDALFARALAELGQQQLVEVVVLVGHYGLIGFVLNGFAVPAPAGSTTF